MAISKVEYDELFAELSRATIGVLDATQDLAKNPPGTQGHIEAFGMWAVAAKEFDEVSRRFIESFDPGFAF